MIFGYFDPENIFLDNENTYFSGWPYQYVGYKRSTGAARNCAPVESQYDLSAHNWITVGPVIIEFR